MNTEKIAFLDTETIGLDPRRHFPWEIAVILREPGLPDEEIVWQLRGDLTDAEPKALEISRYAERFSVPIGFDACRIESDGKHWRLEVHELLLEVQSVLRDAYVAGAVPSFDIAMLTALFQGAPARLRLPWKHRLICVETMAAAVGGWEVPRGLAKSAELFGLTVDPEQVHTALGDARLARDLYDAVRAKNTERCTALAGAADLALRWKASAMDQYCGRALAEALQIREGER